MRESCLWLFSYHFDENLTISIIEDEEFQNFSKFQTRLSYNTLTKVIHELVKLVERLISNEMLSFVGSLIFDGWACNSTHFVCVLASFRVKTTVRRNCREKCL